MSVRFPCPRGRTFGRSVLLALALAAIAPAAGAAAPCSDSTAGSPSYTVRVCLTAPADGASLTADSTVAATVTTVAGTSPGVQRVVFWLDGQYLLTDYTTPYTFTLPTSKFVDGPRVLAAEALMRDGTTTAPQASIAVTFATGTLTPPVNANTFQPKVANPPANTSLVVGAAGDGAGGEQSAADVVSLVSNWNPSLFLYLGDVYEKGSIAEYANWFGPSGSPGVYYGRLEGDHRPDHRQPRVRGGQAPGYFDYWDNVPHYYSFDAGSLALHQPRLQLRLRRRRRPVRRSTSGCRTTSRNTAAVHRRVLPPAPVQHRRRRARPRRWPTSGRCSLSTASISSSTATTTPTSAGSRSTGSATQPDRHHGARRRHGRARARPLADHRQPRRRVRQHALRRAPARPQQRRRRLPVRLAPAARSTTPARSSATPPRPTRRRRRRRAVCSGSARTRPRSVSAGRRPTTASASPGTRSSATACR